MNDKNKFRTLEFWEARNESERFEQIKNFVFDWQSYDWV